MSKPMLDYISFKKTKTLCEGNRTLWKAIAEASFDAAAPITHMVWGIVAAIAVSETDYNFTMKCQTMKGILDKKNRSALLHAEGIVKQCVDIAGSMSLGGKHIPYLGKLQVETVMVMMHNPDFKQITVEMLAEKFWEDVYKLADKIDEQMSNPWTDLAAEHKRKFAAEAAAELSQSQSQSNSQGSTNVNKKQKVAEAPVRASQTKSQGNDRAVAFNPDGSVDVAPLLHAEITKKFGCGKFVKEQTATGETLIYHSFRVCAHGFHWAHSGPSLYIRHPAWWALQKSSGAPNMGSMGIGPMRPFMGNIDA